MGKLLGHNRQKQSAMPILHIAIPESVYLGQDLDDLAFALDEKIRRLHLSQAVQYEAYCDDFGPMNMSSTIDFIRLLDAELASSPDAKVVVCADDGSRGLTNAVFLIGAYMIIKLEMSPAEVARRFRWLDPALIESYRDATFSRPDFRLHLEDCWRGLAKGRDLGWIGYGGSDYLWGDIDVDEYRHYDSPANGNLHEVVPGKFVAFQGPRDLGGADYRDDAATGARAFSPDFYVEVLRDMKVETVARLNEARYSAAGFTSRGLVHHDLEFDDCTCPPDAVVAAFLRESEGAVAVHCQAGLERTGTLIGLWLMRSRGFTAREAMGWLALAADHAAGVGDRGAAALPCAAAADWFGSERRAAVPSRVNSKCERRGRGVGGGGGACEAAGGGDGAAVLLCEEIE